MSGLISVTKTISQILTAGIAITAFSLLLYSLTFNLRDRVARTFALILLCLVIVFSTESFSSTTTNPAVIDIWLRIQWVGIILIPATYLQFSDALLATTGQPSRWRRKWAVRVAYAISFILIVLLATRWFIGPVIIDQPPAPHNQPTLLTELFTFYYLLLMVLSWINFVRAYRRTVTITSKRRMIYLTTSALAPAIGSFPFLLYGSAFAANQTLIFWLLAIITNATLGGFVVVMAYAVAFFGVPWPDRVVKSRLFKWLLRGPITASLTLAITTIVRRGGEVFGNPYNAFVPIVMVVTVLLLEYGITIFYPWVEKWLFFGKDEADLLLLRSLEEKIITRSDLKQFSEMILAAVCDRLQAKGAYLIAIGNEGLETVVSTGEIVEKDLDLNDLESKLSEEKTPKDQTPWMDDILIPLKNGNHDNAGTVLGYLGIRGLAQHLPLDEEENDALNTLTYRAMVALKDRSAQERIFETLEKMNPQEELIQQLRAVGRFNRKGVLQLDASIKRKELSQAVKDALTHYWGGPKLTENPLLKLSIIGQALKEQDQNPSNALRSVLKTAIEQVRPDGDRKFTGEWLLYNILDLKFMEGKKVREIAMRLSVSEADLYRKQRVAIDLITDQIVKMELKTQVDHEVE